MRSGSFWSLWICARHPRQAGQAGPAGLAIQSRVASAGAHLPDLRKALCHLPVQGAIHLILLPPAGAQTQWRVTQQIDIVRYCPALCRAIPITFGTRGYNSRRQTRACATPSANAHRARRAHLRFCRFWTHSKKLTTTPPARRHASMSAFSPENGPTEARQGSATLPSPAQCKLYRTRHHFANIPGVGSAPPEAYMSGSTGMSRSRRMRSASGVVGPLAASARNCRSRQSATLRQKKAAKRTASS